MCVYQRHATMNSVKLHFLSHIVNWSVPSPSQPRLPSRHPPRDAHSCHPHLLFQPSEFRGSRALPPPCRPREALDYPFLSAEQFSPALILCLTESHPSMHAPVSHLMKGHFHVIAQILKPCPPSRTSPPTVITPVTLSNCFSGSPAWHSPFWKRPVFTGFYHIQSHSSTRLLDSKLWFL